MLVYSLKFQINYGMIMLKACGTIKKKSKVRLGLRVFGPKVRFRLDLYLYTCVVTCALFLFICYASQCEQQLFCMLTPRLLLNHLLSVFCVCLKNATF